MHLREGSRKIFAINVKAAAVSHGYAAAFTFIAG